LLAIAVVLGGYYLWTGVRDFVRAGGLGITEATTRAQLQVTATAQRLATITSGAPQITPRLTATALPPCQNFEVSVPVAIMRERPSTNAAIVDQIPLGTVVCVLGHSEANADWYLVDSNLRTRRLDEAYMRDDTISAINPTPTPSRTVTLPPTVTPGPATATPTRRPTSTPRSEGVAP
jgi:hypothetical protein